MDYQNFYRNIKIKIWFFWLFILLIFGIPFSSHAYYFWLKSADNTPEDIQNIEKNLNIKLPVISFIFDPREKNDVLASIDRIVEKLWTDRIYHLTLSPDKLSAEDVALWKFDNQYIAFFKKIKEKNLHVIFRTMHEMNGWRYPRSSNPEKFKDAWIHVRSLSRTVWLTQENIAFDFSVNHRDMPTKWTPSQTAILSECNLSKKGCRHFEDYYPWDEFVDVVWFTFYNRWKAISNRLRLSPTQILFDPNWKTYERIQKLWKPIIIDEVATTSVWYEWNYNFEKSRAEYLNHNERKDLWLSQLRDFLVKHPEIVAAVYFNIDYTHGLNLKIIWEADWAIIEWEKVYNWFWNLELFWEKDLTSILKDIFKIEKIKINIDWVDISVNSSNIKQLQEISSTINSRANDINKKIEIVQNLQKTDFNSEEIKQSLKILSDLYNSLLEKSNESIN